MNEWANGRMSNGCVQIRKLGAARFAPRDLQSLRAMALRAMALKQKTGLLPSDKNPVSATAAAS